MSDNKISRKDFLSYSALLGAAGLIGSSSLLSSCSGKKSGNTPLRQPEEYYIPELPDKAIDGRELKVGIIGCGSRGGGALRNALRAANGIKIWAMGDIFPEKIKATRERLLKEWNQDVPEERCFIGFDAYQKVIDSGIDYLICTTPPIFRPQQFKYATEKGVHTFLEKPIAIDPVGYRSVMATAKLAKAKGLVVVTGTQRHHQRRYVEAFKRIQEGMIGQITGGNVYWNQGLYSAVRRREGWSDTEWMIRDWFNWRWLAGDHIIEQHVHNIDVFLWFSGLKPVKATAFGARHRRPNGNHYDMFSVDFEMENGIHMHSMSRQIDGCSSNIGEYIQGTKGSWNSYEHAIKDLDGNILWQFDRKAEEDTYKMLSPYTLEHVDLINHIRKGESHVEAEETAISCMAGIMGREAAYTGATVTWDEMTQSNLNLMPEKVAFGPMDLSQAVPIPGKEPDFERLKKKSRY